MDIREQTKRLIRRVGYDLSKFNHMNTLGRRMLLVRHYGINLIFDVGANVGQYATMMRHLGYRGRIVSFEPQAAAFRQLEAKATRDPAWIAVNAALGREPGKAEIHVAKNNACSSLMNVMEEAVQFSPDASFVASEEITVDTLDAVFDQHYRPGDKPYLKMDVQGYERYVLDGGSRSLDKILGVQMELSLVRFYDEEILFADMIDDMAARGFTLMSIEPVQATSYGQLLQVDGIFFRTQP